MLGFCAAAGFTALCPAVLFRDLATATQLTQYKGNSSAPNCFCVLGRDYFASAQASKDAVHFYAFHKVRHQPPLRAAFQLSNLQCFVAACPSMACEHWDTLQEQAPLIWHARSLHTDTGTLGY